MTRPLLNGLGFLRGSLAPHFDLPGRASTFAGLVGAGELPSGIGVDEYTAVHFVNDEVHQVVATSSDSKAYRVARQQNGATSIEALPTNQL